MTLQVVGAGLGRTGARRERRIQRVDVERHVGRARDDAPDLFDRPCDSLRLDLVDVDPFSDVPLDREPGEVDVLAAPVGRGLAVETDSAARRRVRRSRGAPATT